MTMMTNDDVFHPHTLTKQGKGFVSITLFTKVGIDFEQVFLRCEPDNEELLVSMKQNQSKSAQDKLSSGFVKWQAKIPLCLHQDCTLYLFKFVFNDRQCWLSNEGIGHWLPTQERHFRHNSQHQPPTWVAKQVFYQIFPDRFANGQPKLSVKTDEYLYQNGRHKIVQKKWQQKVAASHSRKAAFEFYGGDLQGIINRLDYLDDLGISALYLNPIFTSPSNHKYDCCDYLNVDPYLGGNDKLVALSQGLHQKGMRIILDGVLNHTSSEHPWMDFYGVGDGSGAYHNELSEYREFYNFDEKGHFWCWKGIATLPKLDLADPKLQAYFYKSDDSVLRHWLKPPYNIDGWRLDVAHMLGDGNSAKNNHLRLQEFKQAIQAENSQAYLLGEHFNEATSWLQGDQEDGAMNYYGFLKPIRAFLAGSDICGHPVKTNAIQLSLWFNSTRDAIPFANQLAQFNSLDSHDTHRLITVLKEDRVKLRLAIVLLFTYVGTPCIYYGDEVGLLGAGDPDCRRCFPWNEQEWDKTIFEFYRRLIEVRRQYDCLSQGDYHALYASEDCFAFARWLPKSHIIVVINRGEACTIHLELSLLGRAVTSYQNLMSDEVLPVSEPTIDVYVDSGGFLLLKAV